MNGFLLDTHIWVWVQNRDNDQLSADQFAEVEQWQREQRAFICPISVWEIALLVRSGNLDVGVSVDKFVEDAVGDGGLQMLPLSTQVLIESTRLPGDLHRDPADRILVATAREHGLTLVTRDKLLLSYAKQGHLNARKL